MPFPRIPDLLHERDLRAEELTEQPDAAWRRIYGWMFVSRTFDERILELFRQGLIRGTVTGGQGHEAVTIPLALLADKSLDVVSFTHRGLGGHLIWGGHPCTHLNQYFANADSPTRAREGNIHHGDPAHRSLPMISHLGAMYGTITGAADSQRRFGRPAVGYVFIGDGASSTGDTHEAMNLASLLGLPVLFIIENNGYAYSTPLKEQYAEGTELWKRAAGYGMEGRLLDGCDPEASVALLTEAVAQVRRECRPMLIEARTLRLRGHAAYDTCNYLAPGELEGFFARDPLPRLRGQVVQRLGEAAVAAIERELADFVEACIQVSHAVPRPDPAGMEQDLFAPARDLPDWVPAVSSDPANDPAETVTLAQAANRALRKILTERPESLVMGQDIATYGGAFKVTEGLLEDFGRPRVLNTPLAESACTGYAIGLALNGHRPIEEFQFADFATEAVTQITMNAATMHFRSGAACPLVLRLPCGGGLTFGSFHSQELESFFLAMPGLKALYPSNPQDAFNALLAAYEDPNPVLVFEHKGLYRRGKHPVRWDPDFRRIWQPHRVRAGDQFTLVTYGEMVLHAESACRYLEEEYDAGADLFDLRALSPLRLDPIVESVRRTGRLAVLHEGRLTHGFGAELVARLTEETFSALRAPPLRLAALDLPVPFAPELEAAYRPSEEKIIDRITAWLD